MAEPVVDTKVPDLPADATPGLDSLVYTVDDPGGTPVSRKTTLGQLRDSLGLTQASLADAATTMAVNTLYVGSMAGWATSNRIYTLPTTAAVGDRIGIAITGTSTAYRLLVQAGTANTLDGVAAATTVFSLGRANTVAIMRCVTANTTWIVEINNTFSYNKREVLTADRTYYVRTDGSNSNTGFANTASGAFLTLQKAYDVILNLDLNGFAVTVQIADGTYTAGVSCTVPPLGGNVTFVGNTTTPANVLVSTTSATGFYVSCYMNLTLSGMKLQTTTSGHCAWANGVGSKITIGSNMVFGASANYHLYALSGGAIYCGSAYEITAGALAHYLATVTGVVTVENVAVTLTGTPAFTYAFAYFDVQSALSAYAFSVASGTATGPRYSCTLNSVIQTFGGGANYFPGNSAGSTGTGGQYA